MSTKLEYTVLIEPLAAEHGSGFLATVPELPGCMSDGETPEKALANVRDAVSAWIEEARALGRVVPTPSRQHTGVYWLDDDERRDILEALEEVRRGDVADDDEAAALFKR